jgi:D-alanyl-D-alanine carboxypeptidase (penicillin-binding protein 5/6)
VIVRLLQSTFLILCCLCVHSFALAQVKPLPIPAPPALAAKSYLLLDYDTGTIITEKNADEKLEPASLTKLMTAYIVSFQLKHGGLSPDDKVFVSRNAHKTKGSRTFLEPESMVSIRDLMFGMVVQSGNDASVALAEHIGGSEEGFASMMNEMASRLGMDNTHYENSTGLPAPNHLTTARDLAKLARALIRDHPSLYKLYSVKEFTYNNIKQKNRNTLLLRDPSVDGMKTGHTEAAGYCLVASAKRGDMRLISILLGARNEQLRGTESIKALNYGFRFYETVKISDAGKKLGDIRIWGGARENVPMAVGSEHYLTLKTGQAEALERDYRVTSSLVAPIAKGQKLGMVSFRLDDQILAELPLVALEPIEKGSLFRRASDSIKRMLK